MVTKCFAVFTPCVILKALRGIRRDTFDHGDIRGDEIKYRSIINNSVRIRLAVHACFNRHDISPQRDWNEFLQRAIVGVRRGRIGEIKRKKREGGGREGGRERERDPSACRRA